MYRVGYRLEIIAEDVDGGEVAVENGARYDCPRCLGGGFMRGGVRHLGDRAIRVANGVQLAILRGDVAAAADDA